MTNQQLLNYINGQLSRGVLKDEIRNALIQSGWAAADVDAAFVEIESASSIPPTPVPLPAAPTVTENRYIMTNADAGRKLFHNRRRLIFGVIAIMVLATLSGGVYAYLKKIGPFAERVPYAEKNLFSGLLGAISRIDTSSYQFSASLNVGEREAGKEPFTKFYTKNTELRKQYQNDYKRSQDVQSILYSLHQSKPPSYPGLQPQKTTKPVVPPTFPATLQELSEKNKSTSYYGRKFSMNDPVTGRQYEYEATENGNNFRLVVTFETQNAISVIQGSYNFKPEYTTVDGILVTFTKDSPIYFYLPQEPPKPFLIEFSEALKFLPPDMSADGSISAESDWRKTNADWKFNVKADGDFGDLVYKFDIDALKKDDIYFFKINNFPSIFLGLFSETFLAVKGEWIKADLDAESSQEDRYDFISDLKKEFRSAEKEYKERREDLFRILKRTISIADDERLIIIKNPPRSEKIDGRDLYRYDLEPRKESILPFYKRWRDEVNAIKLRDFMIKDDAEFMRYIQSPEFNQIFDYFNKVTSLTLWVDAEGFPAVISFTLKIIPPDSVEQLKDKQVNILLKLVLSNINQGVNIKAPASAKPIEEVGNSSVLDGPRINSRDARRVAEIRQLQLALELYFDVNNNYPVRLSFLSPNFMPVIPTNPTDKSSYSYTYHTSSKGVRDSYHLGAGLESEENYSLSSDADCNSVSGVGCSSSSGTWNKDGAFNGDDARGCAGEKDRYCYDVNP